MASSQKVAVNVSVAGYLPLPVTVDLFPTISADAQATSPAERDLWFATFVARYNKVYTADAYQRSRAIFESNLRFIEARNMADTTGSLHWVGPYTDSLAEPAAAVEPAAAASMAASRS